MNGAFAYALRELQAAEVGPRSRQALVITALARLLLLPVAAGPTKSPSHPSPISSSTHFPPFWR